MWLHITDPTLDPNTRIELAKIQRAFTFDGAAGTNGHCKITNCDIELVGIGFYCKTSYNTMEGCDAGNLRMVVSDSVLPDNDYGANPIVIASSNNSVLNNYFHDCWANSIDYGYDGGAIELFSESSTRPVSNNFIAYNTFYDCNGGVEIGGNNNTCVLNNNTFVYNKFINNDGAVLIQNSGLFAAQITNVNLYNNIFVESAPSSRGSASSMFRFRAPSSVPNMIVMKNNIIQLYGTIDVGRLNADLTQQLQGPQCVHEKNVYNLGPGSVLNFSANIGEIITSTPYWTDTTNPNPINWDYSPLPSSILINNGQDLGLTRDFAGNPVNDPPEIGILEYI